jgi:hypothetical protein
MHPGHDDRRHSGLNDHPPLSHAASQASIESLVERDLFDGGHGSSPAFTHAMMSSIADPDSRKETPST